MAGLQESLRFDPSFLVNQSFTFCKITYPTDMLTMTGSFHPNSDIDKLYINRKSGERGLKSIKILSESRILALRQHLRQSRERADILTCVYESEETNIVRVGNELLQSH